MSSERVAGLVIQAKMSVGPVGVTHGKIRRATTGLPDDLKSGVESLSGMALDDVRVHYNSAEPERLGAAAYAEGRDIHVATGQEQHLPHEAWHVVQQAQGRVRPTASEQGGISINDDSHLENEATAMGAKALRSQQSLQKQPVAASVGRVRRVAQLAPTSNVEKRVTAMNAWLETKMGSVAAVWKPVIRTEFEAQVRATFAKKTATRDTDEMYLALTNPMKDVMIPTYVAAGASVQSFEDKGGDFGSATLRAAKDDLIRVMTAGTDAQDITTKKLALDTEIDGMGRSLSNRMVSAKSLRERHTALAPDASATKEERDVYNEADGKVKAAQTMELGLGNPALDELDRMLSILDRYAVITGFANTLRARFEGAPHLLPSQEAKKVFAKRHREPGNKPKTELSMTAEFTRAVKSHKMKQGRLGQNDTVIGTMSKTAIAGDGLAHEQDAVTDALAVIGTHTGNVCENRGGHDNDAGHLPYDVRVGDYVEWGIRPPTNHWPGGRRLVQDTTYGHIYYTWTHYGQNGAPAFVLLTD